MYGSGTEPGSSGSPIVKEVASKLVIAGLHKAAEIRSYEFNMGTLFSEILHDLHGEEVKRSKSIIWCTSTCL